MGAIQSLVAVTDIASPVVAGFMLGLGLYAVWAGAVVAIAGQSMDRHRIRTDIRWNLRILSLSHQ